MDLKPVLLVLILGFQDGISPQPGLPDKGVPDVRPAAVDEQNLFIPGAPRHGTIIVGSGGAKAKYTGPPSPPEKYALDHSNVPIALSPGKFGVVNKYEDEPKLSANVTLQADSPTVRLCLLTLQEATGLQFKAADASFENYVVANQLQVDSVPAYAFMNLLETATNMKCKWRRHETGFVLEIEEMTNDAQIVSAEPLENEFPWIRNVLICGILLLGASVLGVFVLRKRRQRALPPSEGVGILAGPSKPESF